MLTPTTQPTSQSTWRSPDEIEQELAHLESLISTIRYRQAELISDIDRLQVPYWDGTRSLKEWIAGRLDIQPRTAGDLAVVSKAEPGPITDPLKVGAATFDRTAATIRLSNAGADPETLERSAGIAVSQLSRLIARTRRMAPLNESEAFGARRLWMQPNLANTLTVGTFAMPGVDADQFLASLDQRADEIIDPQDPLRPRLEQRRLDALVSMALDTTTPTNETGEAPAPRRLKANIFIDATQASTSQGETGATTRSGVKVGPNTLQEILCIGETQTTLIDTDGLKAVPTNGDRLPNRTRDYVFYRDGACTADGCTSSYRLEPHHIQHRAHHGDHNPDNLTLLCWFHHHIVVHQQGFQIDPNTPPQRRRFIPTTATRAPP